MNKRVVIIVSGGVVDWVADEGVDILLIDTDNLDQGDSLDYQSVETFNGLIPNWVKEQYIEA